ncbi:hypothetical protein NP233_g2175 [Leucocoprinus birnbaumii]|uniref:J domain-containing protein n=1 Tax=Leucocoprinus birnbaumii TaxID=56174 RepID=A0AAD5W1U5_9AGAR|nr:hypothetical protein NP233_g2175 [Leucocoprinus birnbaumii]
MIHPSSLSILFSTRTGCCIFLRTSHVSTSRRHATTLSGTDYLDPAAATKDTKHHQYPFPKSSKPTPYEIFHLPISASRTDIKSRYYDLVRYHHPDSPHARIHTPCPNERNTRFQSILSAYDTLQNPAARANSKAWGYYGSGSGFDPYVAEINRRRQTSQNAEYMRSRRQAMNDDERHCEEEEWQKSEGGTRERVMVGLGVFALLGGLYPSFFLYPFHLDRAHEDAVSNLTRARNDAQEIGHVRREEVRKRVREIKAAATVAKGGSEPEEESVEG